MSAARITGDRLKNLVELVTSIEHGLRAFGRRNRSLRDFLAMAYKPTTDGSGKPDARDGLLPLFLVEHEGKEEKFYSEKDRHDYFAAHHLHMDIDAELTPALDRPRYNCRRRPVLFAASLVHERPSCPRAGAS